MDLTIPFENDLTNEENTAIDEYIERTYEEHKNNGKELTKLAMQASCAVSSAKAREEKLKNNGFFRNAIDSVNGKIEN